MLDPPLCIPKLCVIAARQVFLPLRDVATPLDRHSFAQQAPEQFRWVNFHSPTDNDVVAWVTRSLEPEHWTAIDEIAVEYDAALVVTTLRANPQALPGSDVSPSGTRR